MTTLEGWGMKRGGGGGGGKAMMTSQRERRGEIWKELSVSCKKRIRKIYLRKVRRINNETVRFWSGRAVESCFVLLLLGGGFWGGSWFCFNLFLLGFLVGR